MCHTLLVRTTKRLDSVTKCKDGVSSNLLLRIEEAPCWQGPVHASTHYGSLRLRQHMENQLLELLFRRIMGLSPPGPVVHLTSDLYE